MKISILGYGTFGSAIGVHLSRLNHEIQIDEVKDSELIFVCVPSFAVISALLKVKDEILDKKIIICSKGFNQDGRLLSEALKDDFSDKRIFYFYGPTMAQEIKDNVFSGVVLAGGSEKESIKKEIESENLRVELTDDIIGAQIGAAMKNVVTIFVGIAEGAGYGQNTQAYILTKGLQEIQRLGVALGADPCTFTGLTCLGDLTVRSRNRILGVEIGKGKKLDHIIKEVNHTQEGLNTIKNSRIISQKMGIKLLFVDILHSIIFENLSIDEGIRRII